MRGRISWRRPPYERRCQLRNVEPARFIVEMRGQMPWLTCRRTNEQKSAGRASYARFAQGFRERTCAIDPAGRRQQFAHCQRAVTIHWAMVTGADAFSVLVAVVVDAVVGPERPGVEDRRLWGRGAGGAVGRWLGCRLVGGRRGRG